MDAVTDSILAHIATTADVLGFPAPPVAVRLKLVVAGAAWTLYVRPASGRDVHCLLAWFGATNPRQITFGSRGVVRVDYAAHTQPWRGLLDGVDHSQIDLAPDGSAQAALRGSRASIHTLAQHAGAGARPFQLREAAPPDEEAHLLTSAQEDALRLAVHSGYYGIPRPLNLQQLARPLGISAASLSERLRRAEGRVITQYVACMDDASVAARHLAPLGNAFSETSAIAWP